MAEPKRTVLKKITIPCNQIEQDKAWDAARTFWYDKQDAFTKARKEVTAAKRKFMDITAPKLRAHGIDDGVDWELRVHPDSDAIIVEIVQRQKGRRSRIETEEFLGAPSQTEGKSDAPVKSVIFRPASNRFGPSGKKIYKPPT